MKIVIKKEDYGKRDELHIVICEKYPARTYKKKKGKGSYTRKRKHKEAEV